MKRTKTVLAWHFTALDHMLRSGCKVVQGETLTVSGRPVLCEHGLHASIDLLDCIKYAPGPYLWRVRVGGTIVRGDDKLVGTTRKALRGFDATAMLREFAYACADRAVRVTAPLALESAGIPIEAAKLRALPKIVDRETAEAARTASEAAWSAAEAAWSAAGAARDAAGAARAAAWAARDAAWAARDAAWAARDAAGAAWSAAGAARDAAGAARDAECAWQRRLLARLMRKHGGGIK